MLSGINFIICKILLCKSTVMQNHVIEVKVAVLWDEYHALWLIGTWMLLRSLLS